MNRRTTSHDVARRAGVSQSTVSLVLNGRADIRIPEATRQRVLDAARELHYARNAAAHALLTGRTNRIGIVPIHPRAFLQHGAYYGALMTSFIEGALRHGRNLLLHSAEYAQWELLYRDIMGHSADGVLLIGRPSDDPLTRALLEARFPTVCVSYQPHAETFHSVDCNNVLGGELIVRHLLDLGYRHIGYMAPQLQFSWERLRWAGAQQAIVNAGVAPDTLMPVKWGGGDAPELLPAAVQTLLAQARPIALVCRDEAEAERVIGHLNAQGLRVPEDVGIACYNSTDLSERAHPPLTSVWQPLHEIGAAAVDMLITLTGGKDIPPPIQIFPMRVDVRQSCGAALHSRR